MEIEERSNNRNGGGKNRITTQQIFENLRVAERKVLHIMSTRTTRCAWNGIEEVPLLVVYGRASVHQIFDMLVR